MKIDFAMIADSTAYEGVEPDQKLTIRGIRHSFLTRTLPLIERVLIVAHYTVNALDRGRLCEATAVLTDVDGNILDRLGPVVSFDFPADYPYLTGSDIATASIGLVLPAIGRYSLDISVEGEISYQLPFYVIPRPAGV